MEDTQGMGNTSRTRRNRPGTKSANDIKFVTVNPNCWQTFMDVVFPTIDAHVIFVQELKLDDMGIGTAKEWARSRGWNLFATPCLVGPKGKPAAGVAIMVRAYMDAHCDLHPQGGWNIPGRAIAIPIRFKDYGIVMFYSVYLISSVGMNSKNFDLVNDLVTHCRSHLLPFIWAGDINNKVEDMQMALRSLTCPATVMAPGGPTCIMSGSESTIDYYVFHNIIAGQAHGLHAEALLHLYPHRPTHCSFKRIGQDDYVNMLIKPPKLPVKPPFGPRAHQPNVWQGMDEEVEHLANHINNMGTAIPVDHQAAQRLPALLRKWHDVAASELMDILGVEQKMASKIGQPMKIIKVKLSNAIADVKMYKEHKKPHRAYQWLGQRLAQVAGLLCKLRALAPCLHVPQDESTTCPRCKVHMKIVSFLQGASQAIQGRHVTYHVGDQLLSGVNAFIQHLLTNFWYGNEFDINQLQSQVKELFRAANLERAQTRSEQARSWSAYATTAMTEDIGAGFRFSRPPLQGNVNPVPHPDGGVTTAPVHVMNAHVARLSGTWRSGKQQAHLNFGEPKNIKLLPPLTPAGIRKASNMFKIRTARADGWHPRHYGLLSDMSLQVLAYIIVIIEAVGDFPEDFADLLMPLIEQPGNNNTIKRRGIGIQRSFYRVWGKARRPLIAEWEGKHCNFPAFNNTKGRRIGDTTWRTSCRAKDAHKKGKFVLEVQSDLRSAFDCVELENVWQRGKDYEYPLVILRISLKSYTWARVIVMDGMASSIIWAVRGLVPGSPFATVELKLHMIDYVKDLIEQNKQVYINIMVDDFMLSVIADTANLCLINMHKAYAMVVEMIKVDLDMQLAEDKLFICSNQCELARRANKLMGHGDNRVTASVQRLGTSISAGKALKTKAQSSRVKKALRRAPRISALARAAKLPGHRLFFGGLQPAADYGSETVGMPVSRSRKLASAAFASMRLPRHMANNHIAWAIVASSATSIRHPEIKHMVDPAVRYVREWWEASDKELVKDDTLTLPELVSFAQDEIDFAAQNHKISWAYLSSSPIALAVRGFNEAGYLAKDPANFEASDDGVLNVLANPPLLWHKFFTTPSRSRRLPGMSQQCSMTRTM